MLHRSTLVITSFSALALVVLVIWAKERGPTTETLRASTPVPVISHYAPPGAVSSEPAANPEKSSEKKGTDPFSSDEPARLSQDDRRPLEIAPVPTTPSLGTPPTASPIQLTGGTEPASPPPSTPPIGEPSPVDPKPTTPLSAPPVAAEPSPIQAIPTPTPPAVPQPVAIKCPWVLRMEIVDGRPRVEARSETATQLRIDCDKLLLRSPDGDIEANGKVTVSAGTLEGSCDRLVLTWSDSKITLSGKVQLKGKQDEQALELNADGVSMKLSQLAPKKDGIVPTSYPAPAPIPQPPPMVPATPASRFPAGDPSPMPAPPVSGSPMLSAPMPAAPVPSSPLPGSVAPISAPLSPPEAPKPMPEVSPPSNPNSSIPPGAAGTPKMPMPAVAESRSFGNSAIPAVK
jgi:hypothetical protein